MAGPQMNEWEAGMVDTWHAVGGKELLKHGA